MYWGRKELGVAPLEIVRPRGSGPLDLTVLAPECLPLHTRVFTDRDDTLSLRLYTEREASGLPGYSVRGRAALWPYQNAAPVLRRPSMHDLDVGLLFPLFPAFFLSS